jgi:hypothetical protein
LAIGRTGHRGAYGHGVRDTRTDHQPDAARDPAHHGAGDHNGRTGGATTHGDHDDHGGADTAADHHGTAHHNVRSARFGVSRRGASSTL